MAEHVTMPRFTVPRTAHCDGGALTMAAHELRPCPHCRIWVCVRHHACPVPDVTMRPDEPPPAAW